MDGKAVSPDLMAGRPFGIVAIVNLTGHHRGGTGGRGHPEIRGASVKNHLEALRRRSNRDGSKVLGIQIVAQRCRLHLGIPLSPEVTHLLGVLQTQSVHPDAQLLETMAGRGKATQGDSKQLQIAADRM